MLSAHQGLDGEGQNMRSLPALGKLMTGALAILCCAAVLSTSCARLTRLTGGKAVPQPGSEMRGTERRVPLPPTVQDFEETPPETLDNPD